MAPRLMSEALSMSRRAAALAPNRADVHFRLGCNAAVASVEDNDWRNWVFYGVPVPSLAEAREARQALKAAVVLQPRWPRAHALLAALCWFWEPRDEACALEHVSIALKLDHQNPTVLEVGAAMVSERKPALQTCLGPSFMVGVRVRREINTGRI